MNGCRITSYNVCYTKLLRYSARAERAGLGDQVRFVGAADDVRSLYAAADCLILPTRYRITSYNVCYTKLLRMESARTRLERLLSKLPE